MNPTSAPLSDDAFLRALEPLTTALETLGFEPLAEAPQPTWARPSQGNQEKFVLWRHPRMPWSLHAYVATTRSVHAVHLRLFDVDWRPARVLPGHLEKGWPFDAEASLAATARLLLDTLLPRALAWLEAPVPGEEVMRLTGRVASLLSPGPLLEQHRRRAQWLEDVGRPDEAAFVRGLVAEIESLFAGRDGD